MNPGATYFVVTALAGVLVLLGWLFATTGNSRSGTILTKSLLLFVLPILLAPSGFLKFPLSMWLWVAGEEALKAFASTREERREDKFWLVALFGVWELLIDKPFWGLAITQSGESWDRLALGGLLYATVLPVLMHTVTAAIYAFTFQKRLWASFIACWVIHISFNEAATYFYPSPIAVIIETILLGALLTLVLRHYAWPVAATTAAPGTINN